MELQNDYDILAMKSSHSPPVVIPPDHYMKKGPAIFGYQWNEGQLIIVEQEAPIRKLIFELFLKLKRKKATATALNDLGYRTRNGGLFTHTTINRLLRDSTAKGVYKENGAVDDTRLHQEGIQRTDGFACTVCPAIVSKALWDQCQALLQQQAVSEKPGPRSTHVLAGFVYCMCGKKMYVYHKNKFPAFRCKTCKTKILVDDIEAIFREQLRPFQFTEPDSIITEKYAALHHARTAYKQVQKDIDGLISLRLNQEISKVVFSEQIRPLEQQKEQLEEHIAGLEAAMEFLEIKYTNNYEEQKDTGNLYEKWPKLDDSGRLSIVETITKKIIVFTDTIEINFLKTAAQLFINVGKSEQVMELIE